MKNDSNMLVSCTSIVMKLDFAICITWFLTHGKYLYELVLVFKECKKHIDRTL